MTQDSSQYPDWLNDSHAVPDPNWDYHRIYQLAIALDRESTRLFAQISNETTQTPEADQRIRDRIKEVALYVSELMAELG